MFADSWQPAPPPHHGARSLGKVRSSLYLKTQYGPFPFSQRRQGSEACVCQGILCLIHFLGAKQGRAQVHTSPLSSSEAAIASWDWDGVPALRACPLFSGKGKAGAITPCTVLPEHRSLTA